MTVEIILWALISLLLYSYIGYGLLLWLFASIKKFKGRGRQEEFSVHPTVTVIIPAFNEASFIEQKILNTISLAYPKDLLEVFFVTDGSNDTSNTIIQKFPVKLFFEDERRGKMHAINRVMPYVRSEIVIFSDANTLLNADAIRNIVQHFSNTEVGGVAGEKKIVMPVKGNNYLGIGEGIYWKYESAIKQIESDFYTVIASAGELFSMRTHLFQPLPDDTVLDDFMLGINICKAGYLVKYEKEAYAMEYPSASLHEEKKRKIRIGAGAAQALIRIGLPSAKDWLLNLQYFSRRVIRWVVSPIALIGILFLNLFICINTDSHPIYDYLLLAQLTFYCMAIFGLWTYYTRQRSVVFLVPFYFVFMNWCMLAGFIRQIIKRQPVTWEKSKRIQGNTAPGS